MQRNECKEGKKYKGPRDANIQDAVPCSVKRGSGIHVTQPAHSSSSKCLLGESISHLWQRFLKSLHSQHERSRSAPVIVPEGENNICFYQCRNCRRKKKTFSVSECL